MISTPQQYSDFAAGYYERQVAVADIAAVYAHRPLTQALVQRINPYCDPQSLAGDIEEIGYPERLRTFYQPVIVGEVILPYPWRQRHLSHLAPPEVL